MAIVSWHLDQFSCAIDHVQIIRNATTDIELANRLTCIVGPNGGGKSTLVKAFAGLLPSSIFSLSGSAVVLHDSFDLAARAIDVAAADQSRAMYELGLRYVSQEVETPEYGVPKDVVLAGYPGQLWAPASHREREQKFIEIASELGLEPPVGAFRGGMSRSDNQRLAIIRAVEALPEGGLLVMDEATAGIPPAEAVELLKKLKSMIGSSISGIVMVSHRREEITLADEVVEVKSGRVWLSKDSRPAPLLETTVSKKQPEFELAWRNQRIGIPPGSLIHVRLDSASEEEALMAALLFGGDEQLSSLKIAGNNFANRSMREKRDAGFRLIPNDRNRLGIFGELTGIENILIGQLSGKPVGLVPSRDKTQELAKFRLDKTHLLKKAKYLSGGYKQRILFARELNQGARLLFAFNPFQGIDIDTTEVLVTLLYEFIEDGNSVVLFGTEEYVS